MLISQYLLFRNGLNDRQKVLLLLMISFSYTSLNKKFFFCVIFITVLVHLQVCVSMRISVEHHLELQHFYIFKLFLQKTFTYGHKIIQSKLAEKSRSLEFFLSVQSNLRIYVVESSFLFYVVSMNGGEYFTNVIV